MKAPMALIFSVMLALVLSQVSFAGSGGPVYQPDGQSIKLDPSLADPVNYEDDSAAGASKVRSAKRCGPEDKDCAEDE